MDLVHASNDDAESVRPVWTELRIMLGIERRGRRQDAAGPERVESRLWRYFAASLLAAVPSRS